MASSKEKQNTSKMEDAVFQNGGRIMFQMCSRAEKTRGVLYYKNEVPVSSHLVYTRRNELDTVHWTQSIYIKKKKIGFRSVEINFHLFQRICMF